MRFKQIQIEGSGNALAVIIGVEYGLWMLLQVEADPAARVA